MSRARGLALQNALARYLTAWWPSAESAGAGRPGTDVLGTPGVVWECKTGREFRPLEFVRQAQAHARTGGDIPVVVYWPVGVGEKSAGYTLAVLPIKNLLMLLHSAGYAPRGPQSEEEYLKEASGE